jgi:hypothetical protein
VPGCPYIGFQSSIDLIALGVPAGEHTLQIRATNTRGAIKDFPDEPLRFLIEPGPSRLPVGFIDTPAPDTDLSGNVSVRGWAYAPDLRVAAVDILIDGVTYGQANYGQRRDDVCGPITASRPPNCPNVGFTYTLNTNTGAVQLPNGAHLLQARVRDEANRYTLVPETPIRIMVNNQPNEAPSGYLSTPVPNSRLRGTVKVWGWGWDNDGRVQTVELLVDGLSMGPMAYGHDRTDQCAVLSPAPRGCPNIGFEFDFDTTIFANGLHRLGIRIRDDKGRVTVVPGLAEYGMNVVIEN